MAEIQPATRQPSRRAPIPPPSSFNCIAKWFTGVTVADVKFYGLDEEIEVSGRRLRSPLIYHVEGRLGETFDASLIESRLPIARTSSGAVDLPYWPSYRGCSPSQRRRYLDWLISGRSRNDVQVGYVFIYFYGLERRILLDHADHAAVVSEILRLLPIYGSSRSFQRYASNLLWVAMLTAPDLNSWPAAMIERAIAATAYWNDDNLAALMAIHSMRDEPLPVGSAYVVASHDSRTPRSVVVRRHEERFRELFAVRYAERFGKGMLLKTAKRDFVVRYRPASESLMHIAGTRAAFDVSIPNVNGISSQFKPLLELWTSVIDDLRGFDRAHRKADGQSMTTAMYEALPPELRQEDHPEFDAWYEATSRFADESGWTLVPIGELAKIRGIPLRRKLTKTQSEELARAAECMDLCLEPDARETGQSYGWDDVVSVFPREADGEQDLKSYHAASILLRLGMTIATADGSVDEAELRVITSHLDDRFHLSPQDAVRLDHLAYLLSKRPVDEARLARKLRDEMPQLHRRAVGELLVSIASADGIITPAEVKSLRKIYRQLDLEPDALDELAAGRLQSTDEDADAGEAELILDHERIEAIMAETAQVADYLQSVMLDDDDPPASASPTRDFSPVQQTATKADGLAAGTAVLEKEQRTVFDGLDARYHEFLAAALAQDAWQRSDLNALARDHRLMLAGAIEAVNEWALETCGDWLFDGTNDPVVVSRHLFPDASNS